MKIEITTSYVNSVIIESEVVDVDQYIDNMSEEDYELLCEWEGGPTVENLCKEIESHNSMSMTRQARLIKE